MQKETILWKRMLPVMAILVLALGLVGCGDQSSSSSSSEGSSTETSADPQQTAGGWEWNAEPAGSFLSDEEKAAFDDAYKESGIEEQGWTFRQVAHVAVKDDDGDTRDVYLAQGSCDTDVEWDFITVKDIEGSDPEFVLNQVTPSDLSIALDGPEALEAEEGWEFLPVSTAKPPMMPEDAQAAYEKAVEDLPNNTPLGLIGTQLVSGTNYLYVVQTKPEGMDEPTLAFVTVYADLDGNVSVTSTDYVSFMSYFDMF